MLAHAFLAITAATAAATRSGDELIPLTANEIRHLFTALLQRVLHEIRHVLNGSTRRRYKHQARAAHYRPQASGP